MPPPLTQDRRLVAFSVNGYGELVAALGRHAEGPGAVIRRSDAIGARISAAAGNAWYDAAVVPFGVAAPADDASLPYCLWSTTPVPGRVAAADLVMPAMAIRLAAAPPPRGALEFDVPPLPLLGAINDRAYGQKPTLELLLPGFNDPRCHRFGIRRDGGFACVGMALVIGDDLGVHYIATEPAHRRQGLAEALVAAMLTWGRKRGLATATLQASAEGAGIYRRLGFEQVETLQGYLRG